MSIIKKNKHFGINWIPVSDILPEFNETVMACLKTEYNGAPRYQFMFRYEPHDKDELWYWADQYGQRENLPVTHWLPLPVTPKIYKGGGGRIRTYVSKKLLMTNAEIDFGSCSRHMCQSLDLSLTWHPKCSFR